MSKRQKLADSSSNWRFTFFNFVNNEYDNVVKLENLVGCRAIIDTLTVEVGNVIRNPTIYEVSCAGKLPVSKCIRFTGIKHSSKLTAVLSFAYAYEINVVLVDTLSDLKPTIHLKKIYEYAKESKTPILVVLKDIDDLFRQDPAMYSAETNWRHHLNMAAFVNELSYVNKNPELLIWTILITKNPTPLFYDLDCFFQSNTLWTGNPLYSDIFTDVERARILRMLFKKYFPSSCNLFENAAELLLFCKTFTGSCTFNQLELYIRERANRWKSIIPIQEMISLKSDDPRFVITNEMLKEDPRLRRNQSISMYSAHQENVQKYFQCPPDCIKCMQIRESS